VIAVAGGGAMLVDHVDVRDKPPKEGVLAYEPGAVGVGIPYENLSDGEGPLEPKVTGP